MCLITQPKFIIICSYRSFYISFFIRLPMIYCALFLFCFHLNFCLFQEIKSRYCCAATVCVTQYIHLTHSYILETRPFFCASILYFNYICLFFIKSNSTQYTIYIYLLTISLHEKCAFGRPKTYAIPIVLNSYNKY